MPSAETALPLRVEFEPTFKTMLGSQWSAIRAVSNGSAPAMLAIWVLNVVALVPSVVTGHFENLTGSGVVFPLIGLLGIVSVLLAVRRVVRSCPRIVYFVDERGLTVESSASSSTYGWHDVASHTTYRNAYVVRHRLGGVMALARAPLAAADDAALGAVLSSRIPQEKRASKVRARAGFLLLWASLVVLFLFLWNLQE